MEIKNVEIASLTQSEEEKLKQFEKNFVEECGKKLYLLVFDKK